MDYLIPIAHAGAVADATPIATVVGNILTFLLTISGTIGIIVIVVAGVLFLASRGDTQMHESAMRAMRGALVGIAAIMGVMVILRQIAVFLTGRG